MAYKRYDSPNHPRWDERTTDPQPTDAPARWQSGRARSGRCADHVDHTTGTAPPLVTRAETNDDVPVELADGPNWIRITAELPDRSLDDVRVTAAGGAMRIRAARSSSDRSDGIDRTIALSGAADPGEAVVAYRDPALSVLVPKHTTG
ncbi:hypothetical protein [Halorussus sp. AFM4]|uniref:hypothetical protein n=1 Tax=Halorussus sp. AFM4 TaxID=3421651 RepID=UPI003EBAD121